MVEVGVQVRVRRCDAWEDLVFGLLPAFAQEVESLIVPAWLLLGVQEGTEEFEKQLRVGRYCFKKGDWKTTPKERKGFCAGRSPWGGF